VPDEIHVAADDAVDFRGGDAGVIERGEYRLGSQGEVTTAGVAAEVSRPDPGDGA
jgi:hypothetical protein